MSEKQAKRMRKQLRNVVQEMLPAVLTKELVQDGYDRLSKQINGRLDAVDKYLKNTLNLVDERSKDSLDYMIRNVAKTQPLSPPETAPSDIIAQDNDEEEEAVQHDSA